MNLTFIHGLAKLSRKQVADVRERYEQGEKQVMLAHRFGVNQSTISRAVNKGYKLVTIDATEVSGQ